jgi:putative FmdB family regulatory protein
MPVYEYVCIDCNHRFALELIMEEFEANPIIQCPQCLGNNIEDTVKNFIRGLNIDECNECEEIEHLQEAYHINVAPLFWQGKGVKNIPLVMIGSNPSVVGTPNEPRRREVTFEYYFDYYQNRNESEQINKVQALERGITIPKGYWGRCYNLAARKLITGREVRRWKDYVLMEAIHCFYNSENSLNRVQRARIAKTCFNRHTRNMLLFLKPKMIVLLGDTPFELLREYLGAPNEYGFYRMTIEGEINGIGNILHIPVMKHRHPNFRGRFYFDDQIYEAFREFVG